MTAWPHARGLRAPERAPRGVARCPRSKSEALRAIVIAARADWLARPASIGPLRADALGGDVAAALAVARALGARVEDAGERVVIAPRPAGRRAEDRIELAVGESATLARFATAIAALDPHYAEARVAGLGTLARRRSPALFRALAAAGAEVAFEAAADGWPARVRGGPAASAIAIDDPVSSQEVSALLIAGGGPDAGHPDVSVRGAIPSRPYLDLSIASLRAFGLAVEEHEDALGELDGRGAGRRTLKVTPGAPPSGALAIELEPDASLAAVVLAAGCLAGGALKVRGIDPRTAQGDARIARHLAAFGCDAEHDERGLRAAGRPTRGAELDLAGEPDLAPVLAALAADAALRLGARSRLSGLGTLRGKESDRLAGIAEALAAVGVDVAPEGGEALALAPGGRRAGDAVLDARGDHRIAFLHALLGLCAPGVRTRDARCVAKTWPAFFEDIGALGFAVAAGA